MGHYFEELQSGQRFTTPSRTITETDIVNFAGLTGDYNPVHTDEEFARKGPFGERIAHGPMLVGLCFGLLSRIDLLDGTVIALKNIDWSFNAPIRIGDTVHVIAEVKELKASDRHNDRGYASFAINIMNQRDEIVQQGLAGVILSRRDVT